MIRDSSRRDILKRSAVGLTALGSGLVSGTAGASTGYDGSYEDLRRAYLKQVYRHGTPKVTSRFAQVENQTIHQPRESTTAEVRTLASEYDTAFYDEVQFGETQKQIAYYQNEPDTLYAKFDGDEYEITKLDQIRRYVESKLEKNQAYDPLDNRPTRTAQTNTNADTEVSVGNQETIDCLINSDVNGSAWWEGAAKSREKTEGCDTVGGELQVAYAADATIYAELWDEVEFSGGDGSELLEVNGAGTYAGSASSALGGGSIRCTLFIREKGGSNEETEHVVDKSLGLIDGWGANENYNDSVYQRVRNDTYEIGIRLRINAAAATTASAIADLYTDLNGPDWQIRGFFDMSYLSLKWP